MTSINGARRLSTWLIALTLTALTPALASALSPVVATEASAETPFSVRAQGATVIDVGKWPEGVVASAGSIWVAESGQRTVARIDPKTGKIKAHIKIGRLPVSMAAGPDGAPIVQVSTHEQLKRINPKTGSAKRIAKFPDYPQQTVVEGGFAYVLLWKNDSSTGSSVLRVNLKTGASTRSADTGPSAFGLTVGGGLVWVALAGGTVVTLDAGTLSPNGSSKVDGRPFYMAFGANAAYVAGSRTVTRLDSKTQAVLAQATLPADVRAIGAWEDLVVAVTRDGTVWLLSPDTLAVQVRLDPAAPFSPQAIARDGQTLLITHHGSKSGEGGTLLQISID